MEMIISLLPYGGCLITLLIGSIGWFSPKSLAKSTGVELPAPLAVAEGRSLLGGLHIGLSLCAIYFSMPEVFITIGFAWLGVTLAKVYAIFVDKATIAESTPALIIDSLITVLYLSAFLAV